MNIFHKIGKWKVFFASLLILLSIVLFILSFTDYSTVWRDSFWFLALLLLCACSWLFLFKKDLIERPLRVFLIWFPLVIWLFFNLHVVFSIREDLHYYGQDIFLWIYGVIVAVITIILLFFTGRIALSIIRNTSIVPLKYLSIALQTYLALTISMAIIYGSMENASWGMAFAGMSPVYNVEALKRIDKMSDAEKEVFFQQGDAFYTYYDDPLGAEMDSFYYSVTTAATVGYGDVYPVTRIAKLAVTFHILASQFITIILVGFIISAFSSQPSLSNKK